MKFKLYIFNLSVALFAMCTISAQNLPVTIEAESGVLGADFTPVVQLDANAITISSALINSYNPGSAARVATYQITFPAAGSYDIYARVLVGPGTFNDDSYFIGNGFGEKNNSLDADWFMVNGLGAAGYTLNTSIVDGIGGAGSDIWKWVNFSEFLDLANPKTFVVEEGALTQTFQIGAREDGLYFDKFVFGESNLYFTVDNLNKGEQGATEKPGEKPYGTPLAEGQSKYLGCAWDNIQSIDFPSYWNQSTPGNAGKWGSVEGVRDQMNWRDLDSTYNVAKRNNMLFKEHTLFWGSQQPAWMATLSTTEQREEIIEWLEALAARYPDMEYIDVVNEPIHNAPNGMVPWGTDVPNINYADALGGAGTTGYDWIIEAFRLARQYFPTSKLILNEYSVINDASATQKIIDIVELLKAENLIDGIGEQAHAFTTFGTATATLKANLDALAATGVPLHLTEVDIDGLDDLVQLTEMQRVMPIFWEHEAVEGITMWGFRYGVWRNDEGAYLVNEDGTERPALIWLKAYINDTIKNVETITVSGENNKTTIDAKGGTLKMSASVLPANALFTNVTWKVSPTSKASIDQDGLLTALQDGVVTITATSWDGSGIKGTAEVTISNQSTGITPNEVENIKVFPNPSLNGKFTIALPTNTFATLNIFNLKGQLVYSQAKMNQGLNEISTHLNKGIYAIQVIGNDVNFRCKVIVE